MSPRRRTATDQASEAPPAELRRMRELVFEHAAYFLERWNEYFGR